MAYIYGSRLSGRVTFITTPEQRELYMVIEK